LKGAFPEEDWPNEKDGFDEMLDYLAEIGKGTTAEEAGLWAARAYIHAHEAFIMALLLLDWLVDTTDRLSGRTTDPKIRRELRAGFVKAAADMLNARLLEYSKRKRHSRNDPGHSSQA